MANIDKISVKNTVYNIVSPAVVSDYIEVIGGACTKPDGYEEDEVILAKQNDVQLLFKATQDIAFGANIVENTNCVRTTLEEVLKNAGGGGGASSADQVSYDNSASGLEAENVQEAVDELASENQTLTNKLDDEVETRSKLGGHNILNFKDNTYNNGGSITLVKGTQRTLAVNIDSLQSGTYNVVFDVDTFSVSTSGGGIRFLDANGQNVGGYNVGSTGKKATTLTLTGIATQLYCVIPSDEPNSDATLKMSHFMVCLPTDTNTDYQPYSMTNQELTPIAQAVSNRNLLDNPWFTVNQRGVTTLSGASPNSFVVDRWKLTTDGVTTITMTATVNADGTITFTHSNDASEEFFTQYIEGDRTSHNAGKPITLSVMLSDGTIKSFTGILPTHTSSYQIVASGNVDADNQWLILFAVKSDYSVIYLRASTPNTTITIKAVKLELGEVSTLALDTAPNYQQELAKCQRYFYKTVTYGTNSTAKYGLAENTQYGMSINALFPVPMRAVPTITMLAALDRTKQQTITALTASATSEGIMTIASTNSEFIEGIYYYLNFEASADL